MGESYEFGNEVESSLFYANQYISSSELALCT